MIWDEAELRPGRCGGLGSDCCSRGWIFRTRVPAGSDLQLDKRRIKPRKLEITSRDINQHDPDFNEYNEQNHHFDSAGSNQERERDDPKRGSIEHVLGWFLAR